MPPDHGRRSRTSLDAPARATVALVFSWMRRATSDVSAPRARRSRSSARSASDSAADASDSATARSISGLSWAYWIAPCAAWSGRATMVAGAAKMPRANAASALGFSGGFSRTATAVPVPDFPNLPKSMPAPGAASGSGCAAEKSAGASATAPPD